MFIPLGFLTMAPLRYAAKCDPFLSLDYARVEGVRVQILPSGNTALLLIGGLRALSDDGRGRGRVRARREGDRGVGRRKRVGVGDGLGAAASEEQLTALLSRGGRVHVSRFNRSMIFLSNLHTAYYKRAVTRRRGFGKLYFENSH